MYPTTWHSFWLAILVTFNIRSLWRSSIILGLISSFWFPLTLGIYYIAWNCDHHYYGSYIFAVFTIFFFLILLFLIMLLAEAEGTLTQDIRYSSGEKRTISASLSGFIHAWLKISSFTKLKGEVCIKKWYYEYSRQNWTWHNCRVIVVLNDGYSLIH